MAKFATALVLVSLIAIALATAYPPRRNKNNGSVYQPASYNVPKKGYEPSYVQEKKYYSPPSSYDMMGYASESAPYYQKEGYKAQPSYVIKGSNYGSAYNTPYQKSKAYGDYPSY
ncbi:hypothetical protein DAPPUDRAFT_300240 [Daphnia pulex]|uniref:Epidermal cell-derived protein n=1 Tax=Daphnia pulex TaxID=6669 RepID=E9G5K7_DAPPU|nr:hypothetical protein DAPPUDRAFT_300240 [Daphnia pulex]|eukprot:EFX85221.1 hypothetical protein DAPPUDRAFT_300240 [Daphnia pulex]